MSVIMDVTPVGTVQSQVVTVVNLTTVNTPDVEVVGEHATAFAFSLRDKEESNVAQTTTNILSRLDILNDCIYLTRKGTFKVHTRYISHSR
jgi:hypothetical protein